MDGVAPRAGALAGALLVLGLLLVGPGPAGLGPAHADAARCEHATSDPGEITRRQARDAVICLINHRRVHRGRHAVRRKRQLDQAATGHALYMRRARCYAHQCPGEGDLLRRAEDTGYLPCKCNWGLAETLDWVPRDLASPRTIVSFWMHSPPHREVLLGRRFHDIGVGVVWAPADLDPMAGIYAADFGYKRR